MSAPCRAHRKKAHRSGPCCRGRLNECPVMRNCQCKHHAFAAAFNSASR
ncbi:hypothetical protein GHO37_25715 [Pseudomonas helleri]|uniref:Uncharacterized protein n=1 Tax=Pseudomonas helleri TaxID=1608996 RepID=A0A7X1X1G6_9PSED|nr:hypothetical protein [Pseudomonas helleri]